jgi:hypothetical protein
MSNKVAYDKVFQQQRQKIARIGAPLEIARAALDTVYFEDKLTVEQSLRQGVSLDSLVDFVRPEPLEDAARVLLKSPPKDAHILSWFHLRATLDLRQLNTFFAPMFTRRVEHGAIRRELLATSYVKLGGLLMDALDEYETTKPQDVIKRRNLKGAISEFSVLACLNNPNIPDAGAKMASAIGDGFMKHDARFRYFPPYDRSKNINLQIKTSGYFSSKPAPVRTGEGVLVVAKNFFATPEDDLYGAKLIANSVATPMSRLDDIALRGIHTELQDYIINQQTIRSQSKQ